MNIVPYTRILAIDPTSKGFAWCLLESSRTLVDFGTVQVDPPRGSNSLARVGVLLRVFRPDIVTLEDCGAKGSRRQERAVRLIREVQKLASKERVECRFIAQSAVADLFLPLKGKYDIAVAMAEGFPELERRLPRKRKPWMSEDERMNIFDAVGLALVCLQGLDSWTEELPVIPF